MWFVITSYNKRYFIWKSVFFPLNYFFILLSVLHVQTQKNIFFLSMILCNIQFTSNYLILYVSLLFISMQENSTGTSRHFPPMVYFCVLTVVSKIWKGWSTRVQPSCFVWPPTVLVQHYAEPKCYVTNQKSKIFVVHQRRIKSRIF